MSEIWRAVCCLLSADSCPLTSAPMTQKANPVTLTSYGQVPLGLEGSGAFRCPGSIVRVLRTERWVRPTERAGSEGSLKCRLRRQENHTTALRARKCIPPLVAGATTLSAGKRVTGFSVAYGSPMNPVPLPPPQFGGAAKGKRLNGQARRLTSPHLEVLCRTSTGDYKAPLCCELLMKGLLCGSLLSHRSAGGRWCRKAPKGGKPPEVADQRGDVKNFVFLD